MGEQEQLQKHMAAVVEYRQRLAALQGGWDSLALLTHFGDGGADLGNTRQAFDSLATELATHLSNETHKKAAQAAEARAQVAIDILVRNLFERTADVGFLAADDDLRRFARESSALRRLQDPDTDAGARLDSLTRQMQRRLSEYVAKYSVYSNVVLATPAGEVLVQLERGGAPPVTRDSVISRALAGNTYVESFGASDLVPEARRSLVYAQKVVEGGEVRGVLCLCFALENECAGIFERLIGARDWTVLALLDEHDEVIASSDALQLPVGVRVRSCDGPAGIMRFAGREFLAIARGAKPYQGYAGPRWRGHVMVPLEHAFETEDTSAVLGNADVLAGARLDSAAFSAELLAVPRHAEAVQRDLSRSVWNGNVRLSIEDATKANFARALLREIGKLGRRTQEVFERSIEDLQKTVVSSVLNDSGFLASLAIELFARNLYERANDCRWWALNDTLIGALTGRDTAAATGVLRHINSLYTVYHGIVLFDDARRVVAVSRADLEHRIGSVIDEPWAGRTLALRDSQSFSVSDFSASTFYEDRPTLIYGASLRAAGGKVIGGVAVVFDSAPQFSAILRDILPRDQRGEPLEGCVAMFLDRDLRVIDATDMATAELACRQLDVGTAVDSAVTVRMGDTCYALGTQRESGYREYAGIGARAAVLIPLGTAAVAVTAVRSLLPGIGKLGAGGDKSELLRYTTFAVGSHWYALPTDRVIEATDSKAVQPVAGATACWAGVMFYGSDSAPVAELTSLLGTEPLQPRTVVILVRVPGRARPLGLLVEELGDNHDVPLGRLLPVCASADAKAPLVDHAIQFGDAGDPLVMVLNLEAVARSLYNSPSNLGVEMATERQRVSSS